MSVASDNETTAAILQGRLNDHGATPSLAVDGWAGEKTRRALDAILPPRSSRTMVVPTPTPTSGRALDDRSAKNIATLHATLRPVATEFLRQCAAAGMAFKITSALRSFAEQDALYAQGRTKPGRIVTNARGGYSNHNFGLAFDVTLFAADGRTPIWESPLYDRAAPFGKGLGLEWGGDWKSPVDKPHYQLRPAWAAGLAEREMLAGLRARASRGQDFFNS